MVRLLFCVYLLLGKFYCGENNNFLFLMLFYDLELIGLTLYGIIDFVRL